MTTDLATVDAINNNGIHEITHTTQKVRDFIQEFGPNEGEALSVYNFVSNILQETLRTSDILQRDPQLAEELLELGTVNPHELYTREAQLDEEIQNGSQEIENLNALCTECKIPESLLTSDVNPLKKLLEEMFYAGFSTRRGFLGAYRDREWCDLNKDVERMIILRSLFFSFGLEESTFNPFLEELWSLAAPLDPKASLNNDMNKQLDRWYETMPAGLWRSKEKMIASAEHFAGFYLQTSRYLRLIKAKQSLMKNETERTRIKAEVTDFETRSVVLNKKVYGKGNNNLNPKQLSYKMSELSKKLHSLLPNPSIESNIPGERIKYSILNELAYKLGTVDTLQRLGNIEKLIYEYLKQKNPRKQQSEIFSIVKEILLSMGIEPEPQSI